MLQQKYLVREHYLEILRNYYDVNLIKVIMGIRRSGKTVLIEQIIQELKNNGIQDDHIVYLDFEQFSNQELLSSKNLNQYIQSLIVDKQKYYLFFDEIQNVDEWEKVINSFRAFLNVSIFITGSNQNLLTDKFNSYLSKKYVLVQVYPFTFKEVCNFKQLKSREYIKVAFDDYLLWGGMPQRFLFNQNNGLVAFLEDLFSSIIFKDILLKNNVVNVEMLNYLALYLVNSPAQTFSGAKVSQYLESINKKIPLETLYNYFNYIAQAFLIHKVCRYDIKAKKMLTKGVKYYLTDLSLGHIKKNHQLAYEINLENVVYNELIYRGYTVYAAKINSYDIDFMAVKDDEKIYIEVAYLLSDQKMIQEKFGGLKKIQDNYPKYVLSMDNINFSQDGIIHLNVIDWLLKD